jgi:branched-chain amino acid transport system permease protein
MSIYDQLLQFLIAGISIGSIYAVMGLGFMIVYSVTRVINFAQGEFAMLGGMLSTVFYAKGLPLSFSILCAVLITSAFGMFLHRTVIYPIRTAPVFTLVLATFGASIAIRGISLIIWGTDFRILPPFSKLGAMHLAGAMINIQAVWVIGTTLLMAIVLFLFFEYTVPGKAFRASSINALGASLMGIKTERMGAIAFGLAAGLGALAGAVVTPMMTTSSEIGLGLAIKGFICAIIGGLNRIEGIIVGGLTLGILEAFGAGLIHSGFKDVIPLLIFLVVLNFRRGGLLGDPEAGKI